jgi:hypothetical protein
MCLFRPGFENPYSGQGGQRLNAGGNEGGKLQYNNMTQNWLYIGNLKITVQLISELLGRT